MVVFRSRIEQYVERNNEVYEDVNVASCVRACVREGDLYGALVFSSVSLLRMGAPHSSSQLTRVTQQHHSPMRLSTDSTRVH